MKFSKLQTVKFGTCHGTYSRVTKREEYDSQITLTDYEAELAIKHFGETILRGPVKSNKSKAKKHFRLYGTSKSVSLNLVYPKPNRNELRLYIGKQAGYKPTEGEVWFLYLKDDDIFIGSMTEKEWRSQERMDKDDAFYQSIIYEDVKITKTKIAARDTWNRSRVLACRSLQFADYKCEFDSSHNLFVARSTMKHYVEAHHLVPMSLQQTFNMKLDTPCNIFSLCPMCHSKVHHAVDETVAEVINHLFNKRAKSLQKKLHIDAEDLLRFYNCEDIAR